MGAASQNPDKPLCYRGQFVVRAIGSTLIVTCCLMLVLGLTVLADRLHGPRFVLYWSWCFLLTFVVILVAVFDMLMLRRETKRTRRRLFQEQFMTDELRKKLQREDCDGNG
jgi:hypothetical protein